MSAHSDVLRFFGLRTHPFEPTTAADGEPIDPNLVTQTLDPRVDDRLVDYYFDVYDPDTNSLVKGMLQNRALAPLLQRRPGPVLILVTGTSQTGRGSMVNLCLHAINRTHGQPAFVVDCNFFSYNATANIRMIAKEFIAAYEDEDPELADKLEQRLKDEPIETDRSAAPYRSVFERMRRRLPSTFKKPIVIVLKGGDSFDFWPSVYLSTEPLANYIIVDTLRDSDAKASLRQLQQARQNAALVNAKQLDLRRANDFLDVRLKAEALDGFDKHRLIAPDGLAQLYEPGIGAKPGQAIVQPIGWLTSTLRRAFSSHFSRLSEYVERHGPESLATLPIDEIQITKREIRDAREDLNQGRV